MEQQKSTLQAELKRVQILWLSLILGVALITAMLTSMVYDAPSYFDYNKFLKSPLMLVALGMSVLSALMVKPIIRKKIASTTPQGLVEKFADFRANFILNAALYEGPALISVVLMFLEQNFYFLPIVLFNLFLLYITRPTLEKFKTWYSLTSEENQAFNATFQEHSGQVRY